MTFDRWDVVAVAFPFLEGTDAKRRPALVVSAERLRREQGVYWVAMITTAKSGRHADDVVVGDAQIARRLGDIAPKDRNAVSALLRRYAP